MNKFLHDTFPMVCVATGMALILAMCLFAQIRRRDLWLRWTAFCAKSYRRIGIPERVVVACQRFEESRKVAYFYGGLIAVYFLVFLWYGGLVYRLHAMDQSWSYFQSALGEYQAENYKDAIRDSTVAIKLTPRDTASLYLRACAEINIGDNHAGIADCDQAIKLNMPRPGKAYNRRAVGKSNIGDFAGAVSDCDKALTLDAQNFAAYNNRGLSEFHLTDYPAALEDFNKSIELNPRNPEPYHNRGYLKAELKNYSEAISDYSKAIELSPKFAAAFFNRGEAKRATKDYRGAIEDFDRAIEIFPRYAAAISNRKVAEQRLSTSKN